MNYYWLENNKVKDGILIPKYYDPIIEHDLEVLSDSHNLLRIGDLITENIISVKTGDEIGKMAYGTGDIPFVRTSDISNWEIKSTPKQGVSEEIYEEYSSTQDIQVGDILLVRDGTYLIGTNCIVTQLDKKILYQSHILKFRVLRPEILDPYILFLAFNLTIVQKQIRSFQFTADTIDTIGNRYQDIQLPILKDSTKLKGLSQEIQKLLDKRERGKAFIKHAPVLIEEVLAKNSLTPINDFLAKSWDDILMDLKQDTVTSEFGNFEAFWLSSSRLRENIFLPKYYDPDIQSELHTLEEYCDCITIEEFISKGVLRLDTGIEIGKMAYGTGQIPFIRTSDFSNWEIKHDAKQGISEDIYEEFASMQDVLPGDILLVRDGTYLVGSSAIILEDDSKMLYCGGLYKIRVQENTLLDPWLLLGLLNSYIVKRQIRTKQFTRDVIDTIGKRLTEVVLPIPKSKKVRDGLSNLIQSIVSSRVEAKRKIKHLAFDLTN
jgi:hypothetical protein